MIPQGRSLGSPFLTKNSFSEDWAWFLMFYPHGWLHSSRNRHRVWHTTHSFFWENDLSLVVLTKFCPIPADFLPLLCSRDCIDIDHIS